MDRRCVFVNGDIIVGAGPSGLAVAASMRKRGLPCIVLERSNCIASLWQKRRTTYDRLRLHLPKQLYELPGMPFPDDYPEYLTVGQYVDYLKKYVAEFDIKPTFNTTVKSARYDENSGLWHVLTTSDPNNGGGDMEYIGRCLVVATGENGEPVIPDIPGLDEFDRMVSHVSDYNSGEAYKDKRVLVVGCGNSGMEVSLDLANHRAHPTMVVRGAVHVLPREVLGKSTMELAAHLMRRLPLWIVDEIMVLLSSLVLGDLAKLGLRRPVAGPLERKMKYGRTPVLDNGTVARIRSGKIAVVPAVKRFGKGGQVELADGRTLGFDAVILATGHRTNLPQAEWLQQEGNDFFNKDGYPNKAFPHGWKGQSGLYAVGFNNRRGLSGASAADDAMRIAEELGNEENTWRAGACHKRCISVIF